MVNVYGQVCYLICVSYDLLKTDVILLSHQTYHKMHGASSELFGDLFIMKLHNHRIEIPINFRGISIPIVENSWLNSKEKDFYGTQMRSALSRTSLGSLDFVGGLYTHNKHVIHPFKRKFG